MSLRKLKKRNLQELPALVIAAFGTNTKGKIVYDLFKEQLQKHLPERRTVWAYTSEIVSETTGHPGVLEALALLEAEGYRKVVVQPLYIFPGTEYQELADTCMAFPGLRIVVAETLAHRWPFVQQALNFLSQDFLSPHEGVNLLVAHGTSLCTDPVNTLYIGLDYLVSHKYDNVILASLEGIPGHEGAFKKIRHAADNSCRHVRIIPFMYTAGIHVQKDLFGEGISFKSRLRELNYECDCLFAEHDGNLFPKALGFYDFIHGCFIERIARAMDLLTSY